MTARDALIEKIGDRRRSGATDAEVLDAVLPQVTTVAELETLPVGTKLLGKHGEVWWRRASKTDPWQGSGGGFGSSTGDFNEITGRFVQWEAPLTVVWQPEVTS